jgi:glyoxylase-like metal-dependent hydrolase (beta-lactamase superfamily II)
MEHLKDAIDPVVDAGLVEFIDADFKLTDEVSLIPTPGHTPGHVSVLIQSRGQSAVITGDIMHNPIQIAVPGTEARFDMDKAAGARTRVDFVERFNESGTLVIGSHFSDPSAGHIVRDGAAWKLKVD